MARLAPEVLAAGRVQWQLFISLTWRGQVPRPARRERAVRLYLRRMAREARVPFDRLIWFAREESGEQFGRTHSHVLIAGLPSSLLGFDFGVYCGQSWQWGWCEARLWIPGLGAVEYSSEDGANVYEGKKFVAGLPIMLSESLVALMEAATGDNGDRVDTEHSENPRVPVTGFDQPDLPLLPVMGIKANEAGYILAANVTRTEIRLWHQADITGAL